MRSGYTQRSGRLDISSWRSELKGTGVKESLNFLQDHYYVKLSGSGANADGAARSICTRFVRANRWVADTAGTTGEASSRISGEAFRTVHEEGSAGARVPGTGLRRDVRLGAATEQAADLRGKRRGRSEERLEQLGQHFKESGECLAAPELGEGGIRARNGFEGRVIAQAHGRYLIVLLESTGEWG